MDKSTTFRCPNCGGVLRVEADAATGVTPWTVRTLSSMNSGDGVTAEAWREATRTTPHRPATKEADVIVPFLQASITAGVVMLPVIALTAAAQWPVHVPIIVGAGTFTAAWFWLLRDSRGLLRVVERVTSRDIDGDGRIGDDEPEQSQPSPRSVRIEVTEQREHGMSLRYLDVPIDESRLRDFARGVLAGKSFSERTWAGDGKPFSQNDFAALRDKLIEVGYARWRGGERRMGAELTAKGRAMLAGLAGEPTPPPRR